MPNNADFSLKIKADSTEVKGLRNEINKAFSPVSARQMRTAVKDLEGQFNQLVRTQSKLNRELSGLDVGTKEYKKIAKELKQVQTNAQGVVSIMREMKRLQDETSRKRQGFVAGLGQGLGVAQYLPTGPGMMGRMAGAMVGGGLRRGIGAGIAPFQMPGIGGFAQALQAIPFFGPAASGAIQAASGMYQQAVGYQQSQLQNLYLGGGRLGGGMQQGLGGARGQASRATIAAINAEQATIRRNEQMVNDAKKAENWTRHFNQLRGAWRQQYLEQAKREKREGKATGGAAEIDEMNIQNIVGGIQKLTPKNAPGAFGRAAMRRMPDFNAEATRLHQGTIAAAKETLETSKERLADLQAQARAEAGRNRFLKLRQRFVGQTLGVGFGAEFGFGPTQVQGMLGQFGQARGGLLDREMRGQLREAMAAQVFAGVGVQQSGQFYRMGMAGGGGTGARSLSESIAYSMVQGLEGSQIAESLSTLVNLGQSAEQQGVKIDPREFQRGVTLMGAQGIGLQGLQAQRVTGGISRAAMQLSQQGVRGPQDMLLMRAAGYDPSKGPLSYVRAIQRLEGGISGEGGGEILTNLLGMMTQGTQGGGVFAAPEMQAFFLRRLMGRMGVGIGAGQATKILDAYRKTGQIDPETMSRIKESQRAAEDPNVRQDLITAGARRAGFGAPAAVQAARMQAEQIQQGQKFGKLMDQLQRASVDTVKVLGNFEGGLTSAAGKVREFIQAVDAFTKSGLMRGIKNWFDPDVPLGGSGGK